MKANPMCFTQKIIFRVSFVSIRQIEDARAVIVRRNDSGKGTIERINVDTTSNGDRFQGKLQGNPLISPLRLVMVAQCTLTENIFVYIDQHL